VAELVSNECTIELTFHYCGVNHSHFKVGETLKGVVMDWSDTEAKGLREVIGA